MRGRKVTRTKSREFYVENSRFQAKGGEGEGERAKEKRGEEMPLVGNGMDAKYRQGCQVAETAAAPLSTGTG